MVSFSEIQQFPDFLELFPGNFRTICPRFERSEIFGRMESAQGHKAFDIIDKTRAKKSYEKFIALI